MPLNLAPSLFKPLTWREVIARLPDDPHYPSDRRAFDASRVNKALAWDAAPTFDKAKSKIKQSSKFLDRPFNHDTIDELFDALRPAELRLVPKTLDNACSICKFVSDFYEVARGIGHTPPSDDCRRLLDLTTNKWDRRALWPGMRYLSYHGVSPWAMTQLHVDALETALVHEFNLVDARAAYKDFTRVWNKCAATVPEWPSLVIVRNVSSKEAAIDWTEHARLKAAIERYLARGRLLVDLKNDDAEDNIDDGNVDDGDDDDVVVPLSPETERGHWNSLTMVVWALRNSGVGVDQLTEPRDLCVPVRYRTAMRELTARAGGVVNRTVHRRLAALSRLAASPDVLTKSELKVVRRIRAKYELRHREFLKTYEERDQKTLDQLDDPSVMDALLALPTLTMKRVLAKSNRHSISCAYAIQRALLLELWMCAPHRIGACVAIELEQIMSMRLNSVERVLLRKPKRQSANKKAPEHFLNTDTVTLLRIYIDEYRPLIMQHNGCRDSPHLFPGKGGDAKSHTTLRAQMNRYVRKHTSLKDWHPHVVRKVSPKITLDADPGALEVARRTGGWANDRMLRDVYTQRVHRASQSKYLELLEGRRLHSIRAFGKSRRPKKGTRLAPPKKPKPARNDATTKE